MHGICIEQKIVPPGFCLNDTDESEKGEYARRGSQRQAGLPDDRRTLKPFAKENDSDRNSQHRNIEIAIVDEIISMEIHHIENGNQRALRRNKPSNTI
jgi:hypothetical protein